MTLPKMPLRVVQADYADHVHGQALLDVLDAYARDPAGGGQPLSEFARAHLLADGNQREAVSLRS
jgi:hypothetical protein